MPSPVLLLCMSMLTIGLSNAAFVPPYGASSVHCNRNNHPVRLVFEPAKKPSTVFVADGSRTQRLFLQDLSLTYMTRKSSLNLFGNIFGSDVDATSKETKELARISGLGYREQDYDSLSEFIKQWSEFFTTDPKGMGLITPVNVLSSDATAAAEGVAQVSGVKIVFKRTKTGGAYKSSKEERAAEEGGQVKKKKVIREGGVEILVERLNDGSVQARARRCETDDETTIKEMSEEAIVNDLKKAIATWKKQR